MVMRADLGGVTTQRSLVQLEQYARAEGHWNVGGTRGKWVQFGADRSMKRSMYRPRGFCSMH